ncbi:MAG: VWA domain-containing protein [Bacteriovoracaceae bacterium]|nr:VWA domain-containing protein [Bacteriovoracaceae bacterium]
MRILLILSTLISLNTWAKPKLHLIKGFLSRPANVEILAQLIDDGEYVPYTDKKVRDLQVYESTSTSYKGELLSKAEGETTKIASPKKTSFVVLLVLDISRSVDYPALAEQVYNFAKKSFEVNSNIKFAINFFDGQNTLFYISENGGVMSDYRIYGSKNLALLKNDLNELNDKREDPSTNLYGSLVQLANSYLPQLKGQIERTTPENSIRSYSIVFFTDGKDQAGYTTRSEAERSISKLKNLRDVNLYAVGVKSQELDEDLLKKFGTYYKASSYKSLAKNFEDILGNVNKLANSYFVVRICTPKRKSPLRYDFNYESSNFVNGMWFTETLSYTYGCNLQDESQWRF